MMQVQYKSIHVACPICGSEKSVPVPITLFTEKKFGHVKIQVPKGAVCQDHVFIVFLDVQGRIIGYETVDLSITALADVKTREDGSLEDGKTISLKESVDIMGFQCFAGLIHAKLFNYPLYIIVKNEFKGNVDVINDVLDDLMPEMYKNTRSLKTIKYDEEIYPLVTYFYALVKNMRKTAFLMNSRKHIVQMPWKTGLELEQSIINSALSKDDKNEQQKFLAFYISKFLEDVEKTLIIVKSVKKISKKDLEKKLKEIAITSTVSKNYISFIKEFVHRRISSELAKKIRD